MKTMLYRLLFLSALVLGACEKKIDIKLKDESAKLVVEATIENGEAPRVVLTRSIGYFSTITTGQVLNSLDRKSVV